MFDLNVCYARILSDYVFSVRRLSEHLWTERQVSLRDLLSYECISHCHGECFGLYQSLHSLYVACDRDDTVIPRPVGIKELLDFPMDLVVSGPHFSAAFLLDFYPHIRTLCDSSLDAIKRNPKRYLISTGDGLYV